MGLKSSPYHLKKFIEKVFNDDAYEKFSKDLSISERKLLPESFRKIIKTYFDDTFIFADNYDILFVVLKLVLIVSRSAKIKFSIKKCTFFTQKIKILGYFFDTKDTILATENLKLPPASLYELHSRLSSFQYQSVFIPYLKHISYPLQF